MTDPSSQGGTSCSSSSEPAFDFRKAPAPPDSYEPRLQWHHKGWNKIGEQYVSYREVQESYDDCVDLWPILSAEQHNVPLLLDHTNFIKYCYYVDTREEFQADEAPTDYVPLSYEDDEESRKEWTQRQQAQRRNEQYHGFSALSFLLPSRKNDPMESKKNKYYVRAVQTCRPDAIRALFAKGTESLDANCLEGRGDARRGVVGYAMDNLYGDDKRSKLPDRAKALEVLRLVCGLPGADVNLDTWYEDSSTGPPLAQAARRLDVEVVQILLDAGARPAFPDAVDMNGQWCNVVRQADYPKCYQTGMHMCVNFNPGLVFKNMLETDKQKDEAMSQILTLLIASGKVDDVLVGAPVDPTKPDEGTTARKILLMRQDAEQKNYPLSMAVLEQAEVKAKSAKGGSDAVVVAKRQKKDDSSSYHSRESTEELKVAPWASIFDLEENMQHSVSQFADIYDWGVLKLSSKQFASWPKPPPPPIDYHLISFHFSNHFDEAYFGVAKTLAAALEAYRHMEKENNNLGENGEFSIDIDFMHIGTKDKSLVPLLQYEQSVYCQSDDNPATIHACGEKQFDVKRAGQNFSKNSAARRMMSMSLNLYYDEEDEDEAGEPKWKFDSYYKPNEAAWLWFDGLRPSEDINLKHLWQTDGELDGEEVHEIWLNEEKASDHEFTLGRNGEWAICNMHQHLWDKY